MDFRSFVATPLQNAGIWLAAWLYGVASYDDTATALVDLGGVADLEFLREVRTQVQPELHDEPLLRLEFPGPGDPAALTPQVALPPEGALVFQLPRPGAELVLLPPLNAPQLIKLAETPPPPHILSPGDAERALAEATRTAATLIDAEGYRTTPLANPRLTVGMLSDAYDLSGLPPQVSPRAAKLIARADTVSAIVETVISHQGDHQLDNHLLALARPIRQARRAAVSYAVAEFSRCG